MRKLLKRLGIVLALSVIFIIATAQNTNNGDSSFVPGAWIGSQIPNAATTGTTLNEIAMSTGVGTAVIASASTTTGLLGIVGSGAGTTGNATIVTDGQIGCIFDGATTAWDYVIQGTTAGKCHDAGATPPPVQFVGRVLSTNASAGTYIVLVNRPTANPIVQSGQTALATNSITNGVCATTQTVAAAGVLTTDNIIADSVTANWQTLNGYGNGTAGVLTIYKQLTTGNVNFTVCNWTANPITPSAMTLQWRVIRGGL